MKPCGSNPRRARRRGARLSELGTARQGDRRLRRLTRGDPTEAVLNCSSKRAGAPPGRRRRGASAPRRHTALIERECDDRDDEIALVKSKVGEITIDNELLY